MRGEGHVKQCFLTKTTLNSENI